MADKKEELEQKKKEELERKKKKELERKLKIQALETERDQLKGNPDQKILISMANEYRTKRLAEVQKDLADLGVDAA